MNDSELLRAYAGTGSAEAFGRLVERYIDFVYSAALRQVRDGHLAEDVTQAVFVLLVKKAGKVAGVNLPGWLFNTTRYAAKNAMKIENRRRIHERRAAEVAAASEDDEAGWEELAPQLDEAIARLGKAEREVVLMHYFRGQKLTEVALALGISEVAARKRASRAIEKLREIFAAGGFSISAGSLEAMINGYGVGVAPGHLAGAVVSAAIGTPSASLAVILKRVAQMQTMAKVKVGIWVGLPLLAGALVLAAEGVRQRGASGREGVASLQPADDGAFVVADLSDVTSYHIRQFDEASGSRLAYESLYDRARGVVAYNYHGPSVHVSVNDGQYEWRFRLNGPLVGRRKSRTMLPEIPVELAREVEEWITQRKPVRDVAGDRIVEGVRWRCFRGAATPDWGEGDTAMWLDPGNRVVRHVWKGGDGRVSETQVAYNIPVDAARFPSTQRADGEVVELDRYLEKLFPLDDVVMMNEACGMLFAVHHVEQDREGNFHLICSTRATEASRAALKSIDLFDFIGDFSISNAFLEPNEVVEPFPFSVVEIAKLGGSGMRVGYYVLAPIANKARVPDQCGFTVRMSCCNELEKHLKSQSAATSESFVVGLEASHSIDSASLADFAGGAYDTASRLEGMLNATVYERVDGLEGSGLYPRRPGEIAKPDFVRNVARRLAP